MGIEWWIGTMTEGASDDSGARDSSIHLAVPISELEHRALREAERVVREAERGVIFRLVYANHRTLKDQETRMLDLLTRSHRRGFGWLPDEHLQTTLALANWLTSVRWLLSYAEKRFGNDAERLKRYEDATHLEYDNHFAYRLAYALRDYATHCDFPPISMKVETRTVGNDRIDSLKMQLDPVHLLDTWNGWKATIVNDLETRSEPIDLIPLVAMQWHASRE